MITKSRRKMKKSDKKPVMFFLISLLLTSSSIFAQEVTKEYHKEYTAGTKSLDISNRYGDVVIQSWNKDQIVIDVKVTVEMSNKEKAQRFLDYIDVQFSEGSNAITAKTVIDDKFNFTGWGDSRKFSIDYNIKMPVGTDLTLANRYG